MTEHTHTMCNLQWDYEFGIMMHTFMDQARQRWLHHPNEQQESLRSGQQRAKAILQEQ